MTLTYDLPRVFLFALLLTRASGLMIIAPLFGDHIVPRKVRILLALALAALMMTMAPAPQDVLPANLVDFGLLLVQELSIGVAIGFMARLLLLAFEMAGEVVAVQMGLGMAQLMDPTMVHRSTLLGRWMGLTAMTLFLIMQGHHQLIRAIAGSLQVLPPGRGLFNAESLEILVAAMAECLRLAMAIAAPAIGLLFVTSMGLGILARTVPQMNVFIVGFPLKIAVGILGVILSLPYVLEIARREMTVLADRLAVLLQAA